MEQNFRIASCGANIEWQNGRHHLSWDTPEFMTPFQKKKGWEVGASLVASEQDG